MKRVTPIEFRNAFASAVQAKVTQLQNLWDQPGKVYTDFIRSDILPPIAQQLWLQEYCKSDFYHLDAVMYEEKDTVHFSNPNATYVKAIAVAIEHENRVSETCVEMNKLQLFNTPLKVLISYTRNEEIQEWLGKYSKIICWADTFDDIATLRRQLVIFGDLPSMGRRWTFHVYEPTGFSALPELQV